MSCENSENDWKIHLLAYLNTYKNSTAMWQLVEGFQIDPKS